MGRAPVCVRRTGRSKRGFVASVSTAFDEVSAERSGPVVEAPAGGLRRLWPGGVVEQRFVGGTGAEPYSPVH
jgi:hypothetical protein